MEKISPIGVGDQWTNCIEGFIKARACPGWVKCRNPSIHLPSPYRQRHVVADPSYSIWMPVIDGAGYALSFFYSRQFTPQQNIFRV
ncbi:MAG: hypothetical protein Q8L02_00270 [Candidatus Nitrotoga sp.]|nr:hypothetical protein [Candidatus Nitrotoga sp.]